MTTDEDDRLDDDAIRTVVERLSRPHPSGGAVIERAAILAEGASSSAILAWISLHEWEPEETAPAPVGRGLSGMSGLHSARDSDRRRADSRAPRRYVLRP
jgi:hypothetical protein